jgi:excisionase family DNA binding protein
MGAAVAERRVDQDDCYMSVAELERYSGLSHNTIRKYFTDPRRPLRHYRVGNRILVRRSEFDAWMAGDAPAPPSPAAAARETVTLQRDVREAVKRIRGEE